MQSVTVVDGRHVRHAVARVHHNVRRALRSVREQDSRGAQNLYPALRHHSHRGGRVRPHEVARLGTLVGSTRTDGVNTLERKRLCTANSSSLVSKWTDGVSHPTPTVRTIMNRRSKVGPCLYPHPWTKPFQLLPLPADHLLFTFRHCLFSSSWDRRSPLFSPPLSFRVPSVRFAFLFVSTSNFVPFYNMST